MAGNYTVTENRERGGYCTFEMEFTEYGKPGFSGVGPSAGSQTLSAAGDTQQSVADTNSALVGAGYSQGQIDALYNNIPSDI